jgi:methionyl-tRNA formyltransferase
MSNPNKINFTFWGTDTLAVIVADKLTNLGFKPRLVISTPDKPAGRHLVLTPPPMKLWAEKNNIPCLQPAKLKSLSPEEKSAIDSAKYIFVVASYGKIIPEELVNLSEHGTLNIHPSLLPRHRGPTPIETAILSGDTETGVTIMKLDAEMDHGPIIAQKHIPLVDWQPTYTELHDKLAEEGATLLAQVLPGWLAGDIEATEQNHRIATYTKKSLKADGEITLDPNQAEANYRKIRAYENWPGTYFFIDHQSKKLRVLIKKASLENGQLKLDRVLPEGKKEMDWESFEKGYLAKS